MNTDRHGSVGSPRRTREVRFARDQAAEGRRWRRMSVDMGRPWSTPASSRRGSSRASSTPCRVGRRHQPGGDPDHRAASAYTSPTLHAPPAAGDDD